MALLNQVLDQRVLGRQIEDVVLHDPGGYDQDRLGLNGFRGGSVLNQFHEPIAIDDLARSDGHRFSHLEGLCAYRFAAEHGPRPILQEIGYSPEEVTPALFEGGLKTFGLVQGKFVGAKISSSC